MRQTDSKRRMDVKLALGVFYVLWLLTAAVLLSESGTTTPPMGYKIF